MAAKPPRCRPGTGMTLTLAMNWDDRLKKLPILACSGFWLRRHNEAVAGRRH